MWTRQHRQRNTGRLIVPGLCALFLSYFGFHAYHGEFGMYSKYQLQDRVTVLEKNYKAINKTRTELESRVQLLHDGTLERDMLDELARRALNVSRPDEVTIMLPAQN
jgi:cell division protein FtsB